MSKIPLTWTTEYDLLISSTIDHVQGGTFGGTKDDVLLRKCEFDTALLTPQMKAECAEAWAAGVAHLEAFVRRNFVPVGRTTSIDFWGNDD